MAAKRKRVAKKSGPPMAYQLKVMLLETDPPIWRRLLVPADVTLGDLNYILQAAMGWTNSHLYEIRGGGVGWSTPNPDAGWGGDFMDARKARLGDILEDIGTKTLKYLYDFGDGWEHTIKIERLIDPEPGMLYPRLIEAKGHCPPEDVGGPWGYGELLEALADPSHERHGELKEWLADDFNPHVVDIDWLSKDLADLAQRWSRQPAVKRRRTA